MDHWTCEICDEHTHEVDYDYLGSGTNHLSCELKQEDLQKKSDKIMEQLELDFKTMIYLNQNQMKIQKWICPHQQRGRNE